MVKKGLQNKKKVDKKGLQTPKITSKLTKAEKEVLDLITEEFLSIKQITQRRKCSRQAVYKIMKKLKNKGALDIGLQKVDKTQWCPSDIRLHGQEFNIKILWQDHKYQKALQKSNTIFLNGHIIRLYKNSIEIYAGEGKSFFGKDESEATSKSLAYWKKLFIRLEHDLKIIIIKNRSQNIRIVNQHYARGDSEIYENAIQNKKVIRVFAKEDGKLAFITDDSFGFNEDETVHPRTAQKDRRAVDKHVNDWRLHDSLTNSELTNVTKENTIQQQQTIATVNNLVKLQKELPRLIGKWGNQLDQYHRENLSHLKLIQEYRKENVRWRKAKVKEIKKDLKLGTQSKITDFEQKF